MVDNKKQTGSKRYLMKNDSMKSQYRINEQIRAKEVRIVGDDVEPKVYPIFQALKLAEEKELDLVEISPNAQPPVCRIIDYSKFLYQLKKRQKEQKAKQVKVNVKEIRFGPQTDDHDYNFKLKHAKGFLEHLVLHRLEEPYKEVFQLRVFGELSFSQIAAIFGKTESWA